MSAKDDPRRAIPSMSELLESEEAGALIARHSRGPVLGALRAVADDLRKSGSAADVRAMVDAARTKLEATNWTGCAPW